MFKLVPKIFDYFGTQARTQDINKDASGKGTYERFIESKAIFIDEDILPLIDNLTENLLDLDKMMLRYRVYAEGDKGIELFINNTDNFRKRVLKYHQKLVQIKGTKLAYKILFGMLNVSVTINEIFPLYGLDSSTTFDSPNRVFDSKCANCTKYTLTLLGSSAITPELTTAIENIIKFNNPINAVLLSWNYGVPLPSGDLNNDFNNDFF